MVICLAVILLSGCEAVLNSLVNEPLFSAGDEWYDGQTYQIVKISACSYEFEEDSEYVTLKENSKGKMIATLKMWDDIFGLGQESSMRISACNRLVGTLCKEIIYIYHEKIFIYTYPRARRTGGLQEGPGTGAGSS